MLRLLAIVISVRFAALAASACLAHRFRLGIDAPLSDLSRGADSDDRSQPEAIGARKLADTSARNKPDGSIGFWHILGHDKAFRFMSLVARMVQETIPDRVAGKRDDSAAHAAFARAMRITPRNPTQVAHRR